MLFNRLLKTIKVFISGQNAAKIFRKAVRGKPFFFLGVLFFSAWFFLTAQTKLGTKETGLAAELEGLKTALLETDSALKLRDFKKVEKKSDELLAETERLKFILLPFMERLKEAIKTQKEISGQIESHSEEPEFKEKSLSLQQKNILHASILSRQAKAHVQQSDQRGQDESGAKKPWKLALSDINNALKEEDSAYENLEQDNLNQSLRHSNAAKRHFEEALKRFQSSDSGENQGNDQKNQSSSDKDKKQNQGNNDNNPGQNQDGDNQERQSQNQEGDHQKNNAEKNDSKQLTPAEAMKELRQLAQEAKQRKLKRLKELGGQKTSAGRVPVDKNW